MPEWSSNTNYASGPYTGTRATKIEPNAGELADGIVAGLPFEGQKANWVLHLLTLARLAWFGDGSDGDLVHDSGGTGIALTPGQYGDVTVTLGTQLVAPGAPVFVRGTLTIDGAGSAIHRDGAVGQNGDGAGNGGAGGSAAGAFIFGAGGAGGAGGDTDTNGTAGGASSDTLTATDAGAGEAGFATTGGAGGASSNLGGFAGADHFVRNPEAARTGHLAIAGAHTAVTGGAGGGGGGGSQGPGVTNGGGGGGAGGGVMAIFADRVVLTNGGRISADGGAGGAAAGGGAGDGGGGNGGVIWIVAREINAPGNIHADGGAAGGAGAGAGAAGVVMRIVL